MDNLRQTDPLRLVGIPILVEVQTALTVILAVVLPHMSLVIFYNSL